MDCGSLPVCNRFVVDTALDEYAHPMVIGQCQACGLVQISDPMPASEILPRHEWITYKEPTDHLDQLMDVVTNLPGITKDSVFCGISYKDDPPLKCLEEKGFQHTWRLDQLNDLGITEPGAGDETVLDRFTPKVAARIAEKHGRPDLIINTRILEHARDPLAFMEAMRVLVDPNGYIVCEVPDTVRSLEQGDFSSPWEEHSLYFTPETLKNGMAYGGFELVGYEVYPYSDEDALIAIVKPNVGITPKLPTPTMLETETRRAHAYGEEYVKYHQRLNRYLSKFRQDHGKIALFGAGHRACTFVNLLNLSEHLEFVADDDPHKRGLYMPGSLLPIKGSQALVDEDVKLCLLTVKPESEDVIMRNNQEFIARGGSFSSIYPASKLALKA